MEDNKPTRDLSTKKLYLKRTMGFIKRAYKEAVESNNSIAKNTYVHNFGHDDIVGLSLLNTSIWACKFWSKTINNKSWRNYRASLKFTAELYLLEGKIDQNTFQRICSALDLTTGGAKEDLELRTSAKKQKSLSIKDLKKIDKELSKSKSIWGLATRLWLRAGILTGLRPIEWRKATLVKTAANIVLEVKNAKNTNSRANGEERHLNLNHLSSEDIKIIENHLKIVAEFKESRSSWNNFYNGCSNLLREKNKKAFPTKTRRPTLYSSRHQFSANSKASGCSPEEVAALMGHASDLTAQMTYGKKIYGTRGRKPKIDQDEVNTVRKHKKTEKYFSNKTNKNSFTFNNKSNKK